MSRNPSSAPLSLEAFEALVLDRISNTNDLYDLDGETFLRMYDGRVVTGEANLIVSEGF